MRIHLVCDQKWRDLPGLAALRLALEARGHSALISSTKDIHAMIRLYRPDCVVMNHLFSPANQHIAASLRAAGIAVAILPTEGAVRPELRGLGNGEFSAQWPLDLYLAWSEEAAAGVRAQWGYDETKVQTVGCARLDFYTPAFESAVTTRAAFCEAYGLRADRPIVTWATAYAYAEVLTEERFRAQFIEESAVNGMAESYRRIGFSPLQLPESHAQGRRASAEAFFALSRARPDWQFVIRPHPLERRGFYLEEMEKLGRPNVIFAPQDYIWNILRSSDLHLHRQCTTAVEAWMWDKPTIELGMDRAEGLDWADREVGSDRANTAEELIAMADAGIAGRGVSAERTAYRRAYIHKWFGAADGRRTQVAAARIDALLAARGRRPLRRIPGMRASLGDCVLAGARYALGLLPNAPLTRHVPPKVLDPMDKQITRTDVARHVRRMRESPFAGPAE